MSVEAGTEGRRERGDAAFSYECHRCLRCCHDKLIQVNPYEAARLARRIGTSTTDFAARYLEDGVFLRRVERGACVFLGPEGCTVHPDRPLVCRLYPLGRHVAPSGEVTYSHHEPHPETEGVYGREGTIAGFLDRQGVAPFTAAADRYLAILQRLFDAWRVAPAAETPEAADGEERAAALLLDLDRAVSDYCSARGLPEPSDIDARMEVHLSAIAEWLEK
jgi:Fe-S-cluster containining protein